MGPPTQRPSLPANQTLSSLPTHLWDTRDLYMTFLQPLERIPSFLRPSCCLFMFSGRTYPLSSVSTPIVTKFCHKHFSHDPLVSCLPVFPISSALKGWQWMHVFPSSLCWTEMFTESVPPFLPPSLSLSFLPFLLSSPRSPFPLSFLHSFSTLSPSFYPSFFYSLIIQPNCPWTQSPSVV